MHKKSRKTTALKANSLNAEHMFTFGICNLFGVNEIFSKVETTDFFNEMNKVAKPTLSTNIDSFAV